MDVCLGTVQKDRHCLECNVELKESSDAILTIVDIHVGTMITGELLSWCIPCGEKRLLVKAEKLGDMRIKL